MKRKVPQELQELQKALQEELRQLGGLPLKHDTFFSETFKIVELARGFLRCVLPLQISEKLDIDRLAVESQEFLSVIFRKTRADMIYSVPILGREELLRIFVILEHKIKDEFHAIFQANQYGCRLGQEEIRIAKREKRFNAKFRLSPVLVIIFYHGERPFSGPKDVKDVYVQGILDEKYLMRQEAIVFDVNTLLDGQLPDDPNAPELYVVIRIMQKIHDIDISTAFHEVLERLKPYSSIPKYRYLIRLVWYYVLCNAQELADQELESIIETITENMGEEEMSTAYERINVRAEARGEARSLLKYLSRLGTVQDSLSKTIYAITDLDELDRLTDIAYDCKSLDEFVKHLLIRS